MKEQARRPLIVLPGGYYLTERDVKRVRIRVKEAAFVLMVLALLFIGSFDGPLP